MIVLFLSFAFSAEPTLTYIHRTGDDGSKYWRIPAIVRTKDGTIITACDKRGDSNADLAEPIQIAIRISHDDGYTFEPTKIIAGTGKEDAKKYGYSDPSLVCDRETGAVLCVFNAGNRFQSSTPTNQIRQVYCISYDNGQSWSDPIDFTSQIYGSECDDLVRKTWNAVFIVSGSGIQLRDGTIMFPVVTRKDYNTREQEYPIHMIWTKDLGKTWTFGAQSCTGGDETKVVELNNGSLLVSIRHKPANASDSKRIFAVSHDKGHHWEYPVNRHDFIDPGCNGDIKRYTSTLDGYDKDRLIHTNQYHVSSRRNLTIKISYDEGNTWKYVKSLDPALSAYSAVAIANNGDILVYYEKEHSEKGYDMALMRVTLDYITDGEDKYTPPKNIKEL